MNLTLPFVFLCTLRPLGPGFVAVAAVGYFHGVIRANRRGVTTAFPFDAALLGVYVGFFAAAAATPGASGWDAPSLAAVPVAAVPPRVLGQRPNRRPQTCLIDVNRDPTRRPAQPPRGNCP
jgi:hypothetical protein